MNQIGFSCRCSYTGDYNVTGFQQIIFASVFIAFAIGDPHPVNITILDISDT